MTSSSYDGRYVVGRGHHRDVLKVAESDRILISASGLINEEIGQKSSKV